MKIVTLILMAVSGISLLMAALMGVNIMNAIWGVSGTSMCAFSAACSLYAIVLHLHKRSE